mmetsp:Transcript_49562/g.67510  ORF Transcript_49562/g.67510 Transcript_49562/m.67510 type:complete len:83 (-) Transcript_49562:15-263(-)
MHIRVTIQAFNTRLCQGRKSSATAKRLDPVWDGVMILNEEDARATHIGSASAAVFRAMAGPPVLLTSSLRSQHVNLLSYVGS